MTRRLRPATAVLLLFAFVVVPPHVACQTAVPDGGLATARMPRIDGEWWQAAGLPELGELGQPGLQPVDFAIWQAADGTWQIWSCIRRTKAPGYGRVFHGWEGARPTERDWRPLGVTMTAEPELGEAAGGLQAPHVVRLDDGTYRMAYGDWNNICIATSTDGKRFERVVREDGRTAAFSEGPGTNTRDAMSLFTNGLWHTYYCAYPYEQGMVFLRTSADLSSFGPSRPVAYGGEAGIGGCGSAIEQPDHAATFTAVRRVA